MGEQNGVSPTPPQAPSPRSPPPTPSPTSNGKPSSPRGPPPPIAPKPAKPTPRMGRLESLDNEERNLEQIDETRENKKVYDYLCRLQEVRDWLAECLEDESVPNGIELEKNLCNGVLLARLGHFFAPDVVSKGRIFDIDQARYKREEILEYRHTDNIMHWARAMKSVKLPEVFIPETADVYQGKRFKTIFCLFALATHLFRLRKAPPIRDQTGTAKFTSDELADMREHLGDEKLPEFGEVGGLLLENLSSDEKALAIALAEIRASIDAKDSSRLLTALQNPDAGIVFVEPKLADQYLEMFVLLNELQPDAQFTRPYVQEVVTKMNNEDTLFSLENLLASGDPIKANEVCELLRLLQFDGVSQHAAPLYIELLREKRAEKGDQPLKVEDVQKVVEEANACAAVKVAVLHGNPDDVLKGLRNPSLELSPDDKQASVYYNRLQLEYRGQADSFFIRRRRLYTILEETAELSPTQKKLLEIYGASERNDEETFEFLLTELFHEIYNQFYIRKLNSQPNRSLDIAGLKRLIEETNSEVREETTRAQNATALSASLLMEGPTGAARTLRVMGPSLAKSTKEFRPALAELYTKQLAEDLAAKRKSEDAQSKTTIQGWTRHEFELGELFVSLHGLQVKYQPQDGPENTGTLKWIDVENALRGTNAEFDGYYAKHENEVVKSQNAVRGFLQRRRVEADEREREKREAAARKIQNEYKKFQHRKDATELRTVSEPSLRLVRKFVTYLRNRDDTSKELELEELKTRVMEMVNGNRKVDERLTELDEKIRLLVQNRINLQDVIAAKDAVKKETASHFAHRTGSQRKREKEANDVLEQLLFHLQTDSAYAANLLTATEQDDHWDVVESGLAPVFGFASDSREEFLLVRLLSELLLRDIEGLGSPEKFDRSLLSIRIISRVFATHPLSHMSASVPQALKDELSAFLAKENAISYFNLKPEEIYTSLTGAKTASLNQAVEDPEVQKVLNVSKEYLATWSERIARKLLTDFKLPLTSASEVRTATGITVDDDGIRRLDAIATFMEFAVANRGYGNSHWYLTSLNRQIHTINEEFKAYIVEVTRGPGVDELYEGLNEFTSFDPANKPTLTIVTEQLAVILQQLKKHVDTVTPEARHARIKDLIKKAKPLGEGVDKTITLQLHPLPGEDANHGQPEQELFVKTKKYVVDLLLSGCIGEDLPELLSRKARSPEEDSHKRLHNTGPEIFPTVEGKQTAVLANLVMLETAGRVSKDNNYQAVVTAIANDIRQADRRRREREEQKRSLDRTQAQLQIQREELQKGLAQYEQYLDTCLSNLSRNPLRASIRADTKAAGKLTKSRQSHDVPKSVKASAQKLFMKGVLVDVVGFENTKKLAKLNVEFHSNSEKRGVFGVSLAEGKSLIGNYDFDFQEVLHSQYAEDETFIVGDKITFHVGKLILFINKKFYNN